MSGQEKKRRPTGGTSTGDGQDDSFETVTVPPVDDISKRIGEALKQKQKPTPCRLGCYCDPCLYKACNGHKDPILTAGQYAAGERRE